jgi:hypothetical protein
MRILIIIGIIWALLFGACRSRFEGGYVCAKVKKNAGYTFCLRGTIAGRNTWEWVSVPKSDYRAADLGEWYYIK